MNVGLKPTVENIEVFSNMLSQDFIQETIARSEQNKEILERSRVSVEKISESGDGLSRSFKDMSSDFSIMESQFGGLKAACRENGKVWDRLASMNRELSEKYKSDAEMLRKNSEKIRKNAAAIRASLSC